MTDDQEPLEESEGDGELEVDPEVVDEKETEVAEEPDSEAAAGDAPDRRGRAMKEPPPPKNWRVEAQSPEGIRVTLGRFVTKEEAEPEVERIKQDGFYTKVRLVESA